MYTESTLNYKPQTAFRVIVRRRVHLKMITKPQEKSNKPLKKINLYKAPVPITSTFKFPEPISQRDKLQTYKEAASKLLIVKELVFLLLNRKN